MIIAITKLNQKGQYIQNVKEVKINLNKFYFPIYFKTYDIDLKYRFKNKDYSLFEWEHEYLKLDDAFTIIDKENENEDHI